MWLGMQTQFDLWQAAHYDRHAYTDEKRAALVTQCRGLIAGGADALRKRRRPFGEPGVRVLLVEERSTVGSLAGQAQADVLKLVEAGMAQWLQSVIVTLESVNRNVPVGSEFAVKALKTAVANASSAYEGATKVVKQVSETAQANADQAAAATVEAVSKTTSATVSMIKRAA